MYLNTYYAEATIVSTGEEMCDMGLTSEQVEVLRDRERRGVIANLTVIQEIDIVAAFGGRR